jgi:peptidoglycan/LPS O-acetylase OafA/YrhL
MFKHGNLLLWIVLLGVAFVLLKVVASLIGSLLEKRIHRKCRRNHGRVVSRRSHRPVVRLSAKVPKASAT